MVYMAPVEVSVTVKNTFLDIAPECFSDDFINGYGSLKRCVSEPAPSIIKKEVSELQAMVDTSRPNSKETPGASDSEVEPDTENEPQADSPSVGFLEDGDCCSAVSPNEMLFSQWPQMSTGDCSGIQCSTEDQDCSTQMCGWMAVPFPYEMVP